MAHRQDNGSLAVLVTGAAGLVGGAVARLLAERGTKVLPVDRVQMSSDGLDILACDVADIHRLHELASDGLDGVIHCGAYSGPMVARDQPYSMVQVNIIGTANVLEAARIHGARRLVYCSSTSAYGSTSAAAAAAVVEDSVLRPASLYGASKVASEQLVTAYADQYGLSGVSLRLSWVYGPRRSTNCIIRTMIQDAQALRPTRLPFGRDFPRQFVHVDDAARALILALDAKTLPRRTYNITGGSCLTLGEVGELVRELLPCADIALESGPDPVDEYQHAFSIEAASRDLDYRPSLALREGIKRYADWLAVRQSVPAV